MVFDKLLEKFSAPDEKYEILYHRYSKLKLENQNLKKKHRQDMNEHKEKLHFEVAMDLIKIYRDVETAKVSSFKVKATDKDLQRFIIDFNKIEKHLKEIMKKYNIEEIQAKERFFDPELHEVASYEDAKGMKKGLVMKTVKKGFKIKGKTVVKPKVLVTK